MRMKAITLNALWDYIKPIATPVEHKTVYLKLDPDADAVCGISFRIVLH